MATATTESVASNAADESIRPYRMSAEVYEKIVEAGVFGDKSPIFLWKGQLVLPMTKGPNHEYPLIALHGALFRLLPEGWHIRQESPVKIRDDSEPEPDLSVIRRPLGDYKGRTPDARDVALAVEVSVSSLRFDSGEKLAGYAEAAVPVYWVVNLIRQRIDVYTGPSGPTEAPGYAEHHSYNPDEDVPVTLDGREVGRIAVKDVLP
jgi:Uma2 family endonuclease